MSSFADLGGGVKKSGNYVWDTDTLSWVKMAQPATGTGSGGALTNAELRASPVPISGSTTSLENAEATRVDVASGTVTYVGNAPTGTATTASAWKIKRITTTGLSTTIEWANGTAAYTNIFDNRTGLNYS